MKKIIIVFLTFAAGVAMLSRCNDLDLQPLDAIAEDVFYQTPEDFTVAVLASYSSMQNLNGTSTENLGEQAEWWKMTLMTTDDATLDELRIGNGATNQNMENLNFLATDVSIQSVFTHIYQGIFRANLVIEKLGEDNELTEDQKTAFEAEARFMRAFFHFQSFKLWGGQGPLALETRRDLSDIPLPNSTPEATVQAILDDLNFAFQNLPESWDDANLGRANRWTARAFMGKVNVHAGNFAAARPILEEVYNSGVYVLAPTHFDALSFANENGSESIFEIQYASNSDDNGWVLDDNHTENFKATQGIMRGWYQDASDARSAPSFNLGIYVPTTSLINSFEADDPRRSVAIYEDGDDYYTTGAGEPVFTYSADWSPTGATIKKYRGENVPVMNPTNPSSDTNNERLFRFADLILLYAESIIETGGDLTEATRLINEVRIRPGDPANTLTPIAGGLSAGDLTDALRLERRRELAFEGHRLFDLVRWGIAEQVFANEGLTFNMTGSTAIFPLPQSEINRGGGKLTQVN